MPFRRVSVSTAILPRLPATLVACFAPALAFAQSDRFVAPDFRGSEGALFAGWDDFSSATGTNLPDVAGSAAEGFAFTQLDPAAFVTSSGNIYSFSTPLSHRIDVGNLAAAPSAVVLQTRTVGAALDVGSVTLEVFDGTNWHVLGAPLGELLFSQTTGSPGFGEALDEARRFTWSLGASVVATALRVSFSAAGSSQSFQAASLDLAPASPIPEPAAAALLLGSVALACTGLRRPRR